MTQENQTQGTAPAKETVAGGIPPLEEPKPAKKRFGRKEKGQEPAEPGTPPKKKAKNPKRRKLVKRIVVLSILAVVLAGGGFALYNLFFAPEEVPPPVTEMVSRGLLESVVQGTGTTRARDSSDITIKSTGTVRDIFKSVGDTVAVGDPLFTIDATTLEKDITAEEENLADLNRQMADVHKSLGKLSITAPFSGKVMDVKVTADQEVAAGTTIATLVDDKTLILRQYFSYAYEGDIYVGQSALVSISATTSNVTGKVRGIYMISKPTAEGARLFEVEIEISNPGALAADTTAIASITLANGEVVTPDEAGKLEYSRKKDIVAEAGGTATSVNMRDWQDVTSGTVLCRLSDDSYNDEIASLQKKIDDSQRKLDDLRADLADFDRTSPIDGVIVSSKLEIGKDMEPGTVMTISNTSTMIVDIQIDEMDINKVQVGMEVMLYQGDYPGGGGMGGGGMAVSVGMGRVVMSGGGSMAMSDGGGAVSAGGGVYYGTIKSISMQGTGDYGVSYFPAEVEITNDGTLMSGMYLQYRVVVFQKQDVLLVPPQCIQYTDQGACLFVQSEERPENAVDLGPDVVVPDGFYAVMVETGDGNETSVEILSGVEEGAVVYSSAVPNNDGMMMYG